MSDLESFIGSESAEGVDAGALERMREQMKAHSAAMKKDQQQEQKQKKTEEQLFAVLLMYMSKYGTTHPLVKLIIKCLSDNILADVILVVLSLTSDEIKAVLKIKSLAEIDLKAVSETSLIVPDTALVNIDLDLRIALDLWLKEINNCVFLNPERNLESLRIKTNPTHPKHSITDLLSYTAQDFLQKNKILFDGMKIEKFMRAFTANLIERLQLALDKPLLNE